ncbi:MAG: hypothetical protein ACQESS_02930 [Bacillota bacterium]
MKKRIFVLTLAVFFVFALTLAAAADGHHGVWGGDFAMIEQWGVMNTASITQNGFGYGGCGCPSYCGDNVGLIFQEGFGNNTSLTQTGSDNFAMSNADGHGNMITQSQNGHDLTALAYQHGYGNTISQTQTGKRSLSFVTQCGVANTAVTNQSGDSCRCLDVAVIGQHGFGNYASITQY